jgi:hypothetical protein
MARRFDARLRGPALQHIASGNKPAIPAEAADELARLAVEWAAEQGLTFD